MVTPKSMLRLKAAASSIEDFTERGFTPVIDDATITDPAKVRRVVLCSGKGLFTVDGLRRALEDMGEDAFEKHSYYERWIAAVNQNLLEAGVYSLEELGARMAEVAARGETYGEAAARG